MSKKRGLVDIIIERNPVDRKGKRVFKEDAEEMIKMVVDAMQVALKEGIAIEFRGFCSLKTYTTKERVYKTPILDENRKPTGEYYEGTASAKKSISFGISPVFKDELNS